MVDYNGEKVDLAIGSFDYAMVYFWFTVGTEVLGYFKLGEISFFLLDQ
ncbi:hypothetical protein [Cyclobacterium amurskyense]|nr:hypothetical protein [Cyclobacterium amurskyense]